jgi:hypothetical protein
VKRSLVDPSVETSLVDWVAVVIALGALGVSFLAYKASDDAAVGAARSEVAAYATQVVQLDRRADERSGTSITVLTEQADAVIKQYGQDRLHLAPSTYRVLAQYADLDTENRLLAKELADSALSASLEAGNAIEEVRSYRVLGDIAASEGNVRDLDVYVQKALEVTSRPNQPLVVRGSVSFTRSFAVYDALWAARAGGGCKMATDYFSKFEKEIKQAISAESLEASRRAYRLRASGLCGLDRDELGIGVLSKVWLNNPERRQ